MTRSDTGSERGVHRAYSCRTRGTLAKCSIHSVEVETRSFSHLNPAVILASSKPALLRFPGPSSVVRLVIAVGMRVGNRSF